MPDRRTNRLLSLLPDDEYERLRPHLSHVIFDYRKSLYEASRPIDHVYFPIDGVASLVITIANGASAEVGTSLKLLAIVIHTGQHTVLVYISLVYHTVVYNNHHQ